MALQGKPFEPSTLHVTFTHPTRRNHDLDNCLAACKAHIDGVAAAMGVDDGCFTRMVLVKGYTKGVSKMIFEIL